jgi:mannan polymerase II complex ANP1 subunit
VRSPDVWRPLPDWLGGEQPYDLNSWQESETALALADTLDEDAVIVEGYAEYATWRPHLAYLRDPYGDPDMEMEIDGVGGVSILAKAKVFRSGVHFPAFSFEKHAETEGFGKVCAFLPLTTNWAVEAHYDVIDGQAYAVLSGRTSPLHDLAFV